MYDLSNNKEYFNSMPPLKKIIKAIKHCDGVINGKNRLLKRKSDVNSLNNSNKKEIFYLL